MFEEGTQCICTEHNWYNAYGDLVIKIEKGTRLIVTGSHRVAGAMFLYFEGYDRYSFLSTGFKSIKTLN